MVKSLPNHPKTSDQLAVTLVSVSVSQSRQKSGISVRGCWERYGHLFLADFFCQGPVGQRMFQGCEKEGHIHKCFLNMLLCGDWGNNQ